MSDPVPELAVQHNLVDNDVGVVYTKIRTALSTEWEQVDSGIGMGYCDFWVTHNGVEYHLLLTPHKKLGAMS